MWYSNKIWLNDYYFTKIIFKYILVFFLCILFGCLLYPTGSKYKACHLLRSTNISKYQINPSQWFYFGFSHRRAAERLTNRHKSNRLLISMWSPFFWDSTVLTIMYSTLLLQKKIIDDKSIHHNDYFWDNKKYW